ncbi:MAG: OmpA family protein [Gluconacetobacter diazotrophicus]|nr:OmpA family protein [Gluconacetobacter diazotrophicus]
MARRGGRKEGGTVVIRRVEEGASGHHGGAWKVAYADFVTAMMAFFLLMWLINATSEQQRRGIAAYFSPMAKVENGFSGSGLVPGGVSPMDKGTSLVASGTGSPPAPTQNASPAGQTIAVQTASPKPEALQAPADGTDDGDGARPASPDRDEDDRQAGSGATSARDGEVPPRPLPVASPQTAAVPPAAAPPNPPSNLSPNVTTGTPASATATAAAFATPAAEQAALGTAAERMRRAVAADPALSATAGQMAIDVTADGLRIQIMDGEKRPMFARGDAALDPRADALLRKVAPFLATLPEPVSIGGYTDAAAWPPGSANNWTLSSGRADAARAVLVASGLPDTRVADVSGFADRRPLLPADPMAAANRRVVLTLHRLRAPPAAARPVPVSDRS